MTDNVKKKSKMKKVVLSAQEKQKKKEEQAVKHRQRQFKNKIKQIFITAGFTYLDSENKHIKIGLRTVEIDLVFFFKNIILVCEDTGTSAHNIKVHARNKNEAFTEISENFGEFYSWICEEFTESEITIRQFSSEQYRVIFLYFSQEELTFSADDYKRFPMIKFVEPSSLNYLFKMTQCIKKSVRFEVFKFLGLSDEDIGTRTTEVGQKKIKATIISPKSSTGLKNGVRIVSFMMSAETLIKNAYVLRKDNWEESTLLYQRLIHKDKIQKIRKFLVKKEEAFYNNIIVALPNDIFFMDKNGQPINMDKIGNYDVCSMYIPDSMNSICVIDGQHRIYAHYEGYNTDKDELKISKLRKDLHLLVTGLVFPKEMSDNERTKVQSEIFLDINSNAKPVPQDVLLHIKMVKDPLSDEGLARMLIEKLNKESIFLKKFEISSLDEGKIKIASIVKFALRYLVTITPKERKSLYSYWEGDKKALEKLDDVALDEYKKYCVSNISAYFSAVRKSYLTEWSDPESKILSVISINGFIIAYNKIIDKYGIKDFNFFCSHFSKYDIDFSKDGFPYTSSQYGKFSEKILEEAFSDDDIVSKEIAATHET